MSNVHSETTCDFAAEAAAGELVRILDKYLSDLKVGQAPRKAELMAQHPALALQLEACLAGLEFIHGAEAAADPGSQRLGDFRIIREVGRGGMGAVFEAEQVSLGRRVALKILRFGGISDPEAVERFQREAETVANLHHTNIVPIFAVGSEKGINFYAMQFIDGQSLAELQHQKKSPLPADRVAVWGLQTAEALEHAHQRGIIHRDVKPSNLMLDKEGCLWLTDFGLARRLDDLTLSLTGALLGTPRYMSPEQARATHKRVDHRTDVFSLGATLYELIAGQPAFTGDTPHDVIQSILTTEPAPIRQIRSSVPRDLETIVMKCLAKDPAQRYGTARDLADDLRAFLEGRAIRARRASVVELAGRWIKAQQRSVKLMVTAAAATLAITLLGIFGRSGLEAWRQGTLKLSTPNPPLVAEILGDQDVVLRRETLPTQEPISLPAGEYQIRASSEGTLSQTFAIEIQRAHEVKHALDLRDVRCLSTAMERTFAFVDLGEDRQALVTLGNAGISVRGSVPPPIGPDTPAWKENPGFRWPWSSGSETNGHFDPFDLRPWISPRGFDLNGDGVRDVIFAGRHQAWLLAASGKDGTLLWFAPRGSDLKSTPERKWQAPLVSTVLGEPIFENDWDGDGIWDVIVTLADVGPTMERRSGEQIAAKCWVEGVSGKSGQTLWKYEVPASWFELPLGVEVPYQYRWFVGTGSGSSSRGGGIARSGSQVYRQPARMERTGPHAYRPDAALLVKLGSQPALAVIGGTHLSLINPYTGKEIGAPQEISVRPGRTPLFGDVDGDGDSDLIILAERPAIPATSDPQVRLAIWSPSRQRMLWSKDLEAYWPGTQAWTVEPPRWPLVTDLDGDGKVEVLAPDGGSSSGGGYFGSNIGIPWGRIVALEGSSGNELWGCRLVSVDQQINHLEAGPDIDRDGCREVYAVSLSGANQRIFVDALSGKSGQKLWTSPGIEAAESEPLLAPPQWWFAGEDGWPQLIVQAVDDQHGARQSMICTFSAGTGKMTHLGRGIAEVHPLDMDGDGTEDLAVFSPYPSENSLERGGKLHVIRGVPAEPWRRIGEPAHPVVDFDGDGIVDLVDNSEGGDVRASSGRSGKSIWRNQLGRGTGRTGLQRAGNDLDGDGIEDLLAWTDTYGRRRKSFPFHALSGRTGSLIWNASQFDVEMLGNVISATTADLDHDGQPEAIWLAMSNHGFPQRSSWSSHDLQLWLLVTSGQNGETRWAQPLSPAFGIRGAATLQVQVSTTAVTPTIFDLDHDGTDDLIVPGITTNGLNLETCALSGKDGHRFWSRLFPPNPSHGPPAMERWVAPTMAKHSDDGSSQAILVEFGPADEGPSGGNPVLRVIALDAEGGTPLWSWGSTATPGSWSAISGPISEGSVLRPVLLRAADGKIRIAVSIPGSNSQVVVFGTSGLIHQRASAHQSSLSPLWPCDVNGDGIDELAFMENSVLVVVAAVDLEKPLWTHDTKSPGGGRILGISPAGVPKGSSSQLEKRPPTIALQADFLDNSVLGLEAATGKEVWRCPGPIPRAGEGLFLMLDQIALLGNTPDQTPLVYYAYGTVARCRQGALLRNGGVQHRRGSDFDAAALAARGVSESPAVTDGGSRDARWQRNLPWAGIYFLWRSEVAFVGWGMLFSMLLVVIPAGYLIRLGWLRQFGLKTLFLLPLIAGLFMTGALARGPIENDFDSLGGRLWIGAALAPVIVGIGLLLLWLATGKWRRVASWLLVSVALSAVCAAFLLRNDGLGKPLVAEESYDWTGWYMIWFPGAFATSWIALVFLPLQYWAVAAWKWWRARGLPRSTRTPPQSGTPVASANEPTAHEHFPT